MLCNRVCVLPRGVALIIALGLLLGSARAPISHRPLLLVGSGGPLDRDRVVGGFRICHRLGFDWLALAHRGRAHTALGLLLLDERVLRLLLHWCRRGPGLGRLGRPLRQSRLATVGAAALHLRGFATAACAFTDLAIAFIAVVDANASAFTDLAIALLAVVDANVCASTFLAFAFIAVVHAKASAFTDLATAFHAVVDAKGCAATDLAIAFLAVVDASGMLPHHLRLLTCSRRRETTV